MRLELQNRLRRGAKNLLPEPARDAVADALVRGLKWTAQRLPYRAQVRFFGWASAWLISPILGAGRVYRKNLGLLFPEIPKAEIARIARQISDNSGRSLIEMYSGEAFIGPARALTLEGDGVAAVRDAQAAGRGIVFATGHFGNYNAARAALIAHGFNLGLLYRPASNKRLNAHYASALAAVGGKLFPRDRAGLAAMVRHLRGGEPLMVLFDLHVRNGAVLRFFDWPARTSLSPAELALRHDALLVPFYGIRQADGFGFRVMVEAPVAHTAPEEMMQRLNDSLEARIRAHPEQWFYVHKRWKGLVHARAKLARRSDDSASQDVPRA